MGSGLVSPWHIIIFAVVVLMVFGPKKLPEMGRSLGHGLRELKEGITSHHDDDDPPRIEQTRTPTQPRRDHDTI